MEPLSSNDQGTLFFDQMFHLNPVSSSNHLTIYYAKLKYCFCQILDCKCRLCKLAKCWLLLYFLSLACAIFSKSRMSQIFLSIALTKIKPNHKSQNGKFSRPSLRFSFQSRVQRHSYILFIILKSSISINWITYFPLQLKRTPSLQF